MSKEIIQTENQNQEPSEEPSSNSTYSIFSELDNTRLFSTPEKFKNSTTIPKFETSQSHIEVPFRPGFQRKGTSIARYHPTNGFEATDGNGTEAINECVQYMSITAMIEFGQKSFEELRFEDLSDQQILHESCKIISDVLFDYFNNQLHDSGINDSNDEKMERTSFRENPSLTNVFFEKEIDQDEANMFGDAVKSATDIKFEHKKCDAVKYKSILKSDENESNNCICVMEEYKDKSMEEIRFEDYEIRRRILWGLDN